MGIYKNSYSVKEDQILWELHEIRHELHKEYKNMTLAARNKAAQDLFRSWKKVERMPLHSQGKDE